jgi:hypothetical protein
MDMFYENTSHRLSWLLLTFPLLGIGIVLAIGLIAVPSFRKTGVTLLAFFIGIPLVLVCLLAVFWGFRSYAATRSPTKLDKPKEMSRMEGPEFQDSPSISVESPSASQATIEANPPLKETPAERETRQAVLPEASEHKEEPRSLDKAVTAESSRLVDLLSKALAKMIIEDPKAWKDLLAKAANFNDPPAEKEADPTDSASKTPTPIETHLPNRPPKPDWVGKGWHLANNDTEYECDVEVYPFSNRVTADSKLAEAVQKAIDKLIEDFYDNHRVQVKYSPEELSKIIGEKYEEWRTVSMGNVLSLHAKVTIKKKDIDLKYENAQADYENNQRKSLVRSRLWRSGGYFGVAMLLMASVWGYLKIDLAAGGKHRAILRTALVLVILSSTVLAWIVGKVF